MKKYFSILTLTTFLITMIVLGMGCTAKNVAVASSPAEVEQSAIKTVNVEPEKTKIYLNALTPAVFQDYSRADLSQTATFTVSGYPMNSYTINTGQPRETMNALISELRDVKNIPGVSNLKVEIVGSASFQGSEEYNMALGKKRADTVAQEIKNIFPEAEITTDSLGEKPNIRQVEVSCSFASEKKFNFSMDYTNSVEFLGIDKERKYAIVAIRLSEEEMNIPGWRICNSYSSYLDGKMTIKGERNYRRQTEITDGRLIGFLPLNKDDQGNVYYWPRIWVSNDDDLNSWGNINTSSIYSRNDNNGNPGYELLFSSDGIYGPVPKSWPTRP
ncbi:MAG: hypothetical protein V1829_02465 [bacterium]